MKRFAYALITAIMMVFAYCAGQANDEPMPQAQTQAVDNSGPWQLHVASTNVAWRINTETGAVDQFQATGQRNERFKLHLYTE